MKTKYHLLIAISLGLLFTVSIAVVVNAQSISPRPVIDQVAAPAKPDRVLRPIVRTAERHDTSRPLREMQLNQPISPTAQPREIPFFPLPRSPRSVAADTNRPGVDPLLGNPSIWQPEAASSIIKLNSFDGLSNACGCFPPDTEGDIGNDPATGKKYYIQWVNLQYAIWDVTLTPTQILAPTNGNTLWQGFGGNCETTNDGDPIVLFDSISHRWLMSQFSVNIPPHYYQCIAISASADPLGAWYRYAFLWQDGNGADTFNDYGKFGVWPDGYYFTTNQFASEPDEGLAAHQPNAPQAPAFTGKGGGVAVFQRDKMLNGEAANMIYFDLFPIDPDLGGMLPSDLDGSVLPPPGSPNYFAEVDDSAFFPDVSVTTDSLRIWKFHTDWTTPANSTFGINGAANYTLTVAPYASLPCAVSGSSSCIPQQSTTTKLDAVADRLMYRLAYRNFGDHEALVVNHTVWADGTDRAGVRWYEVRNPGSGATLYQQGTYAPADGLYRWMGSAAMDHNGNLALGYSVSSGSMYPSIRATGRLASDTLGQMTQGETRIVTGTGAQTGLVSSGGGRWGDYSMLSIDPVDDCTFWYSQEYVKVTGGTSWQGRIGSFRFPGCLVVTGGLTGQITDSVTTNPISNALITASQGPTYSVSTLSNASGFYTLSVVTGSYSVSALAYGYLPSTITGITVDDSLTTTQNFSLIPVPLHIVSGTIRDAAANWPLYARLRISGNPIDPPSPNDEVWTDPVSGFYSVTLAEGLTYTIKAATWVSGYPPATGSFTVPADLTQNFSLTADQIACTAPGYQPINLLTQQFETWPPAGWSIVDNIAGNSLVWNLDSVYTDTNYTGGSGHAATVDSDQYQDVPYDTELRSPIIDLTPLTSPKLTYRFNYQDWNTQDFFDVDISTNGGATWSTLPGHHFTDDHGVWYDLPGETDSINLAAYITETNVQLRWHYYSTAITPWDWYAQVDDVQLSSCNLQAGGLVVGNTYSGTLANPLANVQVAADGGASMVSTATIDPKVDDSFYTLFAPAGTSTFTATKAWYQQLVTTTNVIMSDTVRLDLFLNLVQPKVIYLPIVRK